MLQHCRHFITAAGILIFAQSNAQPLSPADLVNPLMGTQSTYALSTGNTYPSVSVPWGMNAWSAQTGKNGDGWMYSYNTNKIRGIKQTHQPSPWINDYGCFSLMPVSGNMRFEEEARASWFSHKAEQAHPYSYSVYLADHDAMARVAPTERAAVLRFEFNGGDSNWVVLDAFPKGSFVKIIPAENKIIGYACYNSGGVPDNFRNYFELQFSQRFTSAHTWRGKSLAGDTLEISGDHVGAILGFGKGKTVVEIKSASSFISPQQAALNLQREIGNNNFAMVEKAAKAAWNKELGRIQIEEKDIDALRTFYSCLYRVLLFPRKFYELDAQNKVVHYSPYNGQTLPGYMFTDNGFWDTFRAVFPFFSLMYPSLNSQIMQGLSHAYNESGWLPEWASPGHRDCMIGSNSASLIADAVAKNVTGFNLENLYEAATKNAHHEGPLGSVGRKGAAYYDQLGYVPNDVGIHENAARTLEYAYADFCLYQLAQKLNKPAAEIDNWKQRSLNYTNLYYAPAKLMSGRRQDGSFSPKFNPFKWGGDFTEGNSLHYSWSVFHDIEGLKKLMGGDASFISMLDTVFALPPVFDESYYGQVIHEIREMQIMNMGQYAHGNQPIQHMPYLYQYSSQPWKTEYWVREILNRMYSATPDGYCGDEDNGQTSAWYVFSSLGFYPVTPASNQFVVGAPLFKKATVVLENGKKIVVEAPANSMANRYVQSLQVNGKSSTKRYLTHASLNAGAVLKFSMTASPNKYKTAAKADMPYSLSNE